MVEDLALFGIAQPADQRQLWRDRPFAVHESRIGVGALAIVVSDGVERSEEHTSELQSLMRNSYAVFCLKNKILKLHTVSLYPYQLCSISYLTSSYHNKLYIT